MTQTVEFHRDAPPGASHGALHIFLQTPGQPRTGRPLACGAPVDGTRKIGTAPFRGWADVLCDGCTAVLQAGA